MKALACVALAAGVAHAGELRGTVAITRPADVQAGAVLVYVVGFNEPAARAPVEVKQIGKRFIPDLIPVTAGGTVSFPNGDPFLHNVFSPTTERSFDLGSYPHGETRTRTFPKPGVVDIYCNLHPEMSATLVILPNTRFALADAAGRFEITGVPAGTWTVFAFSRRAVAPVSARVTVGATGVTDVKLELSEVQRDFTHKNKYGETYKPSTTVYAPGS